MAQSDDGPRSEDAQLRRQVELLSAQREIEQQIYRVGYALEDGDFARVGQLMGEATLGADLIGRAAYRGAAEITAQYTRTNIVYEGRGRATKEIYSNVVVDVDLDAGTASSVTSYTVAHQPPGAEFALLVAGRYEDRWRRRDGHWAWDDRYIVVQYRGDLDSHMHPGSQPYN
jgi:hypothetical protein